MSKRIPLSSALEKRIFLSRPVMITSLVIAAFVLFFMIAVSFSDAEKTRHAGSESNTYHQAIVK